MGQPPKQFLLVCLTVLFTSVFSKAPFILLDRISSDFVSFQDSDENVENYRIRHRNIQTHRGWKGPQENIESNLSAKAGTI